MLPLLAFLFGLSAQAANSATISTNEIEMTDAPAWITRSRVERVVSKIQRFMEWDIRRVPVRWYADQASFEAAHKLGPSPMAFAKRDDQSIHLGPRVDTASFDSAFGHELVHIILYQKYKDAIPSWLDEGLANYVAKHGAVDYSWLSKQKEIDVRSLKHPFKGDVRLHYQASTALMEMIAARCDVHELLQLAVGKGLEGYLATYCEIADLNAELRKRIKLKAPRR
jgi:hypothetical protein